MSEFKTPFVPVAEFPVAQHTPPQSVPYPEPFMLSRFVKNYIERHQVLANQLLHLVGVPLTFVVSIILLTKDEPGWAAGAFVGGYVLQFIGHVIEGNDAGELILIKKLLGKPYQEFRPGYDPSAKQSAETPPQQDAAP